MAKKSNVLTKVVLAAALVLGVLVLLFVGGFVMIFADVFTGGQAYVYSE